MFLTDLRRTAVLGLAFVLVALIGCSKGKPDSGPAATQPAPGAAAGGGDKNASDELRKAKPDFTLTADDFFAEFDKDAPAAKKKYAGKIIDLKGDLGGMGYALGGEGYRIWFSQGPVGYSASEGEPWAKACPGQEVTVRCRGSEAMIQAHSVDGIFVQMGPSPAIEVSAAQYAKELTDDKPAALKKYQGKYLLIQDEIAELTRDKNENVRIHLKGDGKMPIVCLIGSENGRMAEGLKAGQTVKVLGYMDAVLSKEPGSLESCFVIKPTK